MSAVGTVLITSNDTITPLKEIIFAWTSDSSGNVSGTVSPKSYTGKVKAAVFVPAPSTPAPSDDYDVQIIDKNGNDILFGLATGSVLKAASTTNLAEGDKMGACVLSALTLNVQGAGNAKQGTVYLYIE